MSNQPEVKKFKNYFLQPATRMFGNIGHLFHLVSIGDDTSSTLMPKFSRLTHLNSRFHRAGIVASPSIAKIIIGNISDFCVFWLTYYHKVFGSVIGSGFVDMVNVFGWRQYVTQKFLHYKTMFSNIVFYIMRMIGTIQHDIAIAIYSFASLPTRAVFAFSMVHNVQTNPFSTTFFGTESANNLSLFNRFFDIRIHEAEGLLTMFASKFSSLCSFSHRAQYSDHAI